MTQREQVRFRPGDVVVAPGAELIQGDVVEVSDEGVTVKWRETVSFEQPDDLELIEKSEAFSGSLVVWGYAPVGVVVEVERGQPESVSKVVVLDEALALPESTEKPLAVRPHDADDELELQDLELAVADQGYADLDAPPAKEAAERAVVFARRSDVEWPAWSFGW